MPLVAQEDMGGGQLRIYTATPDPGVVNAEDTADVDVTIAGLTSSDKVVSALAQGNPGDRVTISGAVCATDKVTLTYSNSGDDNSADLSAVAVVITVLKM